MSVKTNNIYGKIVISDKTIERFVARVAMDCYGIVEFASKNLMDSIISFLKFGSEVKGVKVRSSGDRIFIDVSVIVKYGVSIKAVVEALKESIKYRVERFTGMLVDTMNVRVMGVKE
ncbi:MAG: Asp23/Gls24 family envelope stress response protein [Clostridiales bacterium]|nr:Asp23/Gls24 family envelope stress response protein [Clostridiales bacterium]